MNHGGSQENRIRFACEIISAISNAIGAHKVGVRLAPFITQRGMDDSEAIDTILLAAKQFEQTGIAYIHLAEADWDDAPSVTPEFRAALRQYFSGAIIVAGNYTEYSGAQLIEQGFADYIAFGRRFIANPDLPYRIQEQRPLNTITDGRTLFGGTAKGYTDYPAYQK